MWQYWFSIFLFIFPLQSYAQNCPGMRHAWVNSVADQELLLVSEVSGNYAISRCSYSSRSGGEVDCAVVRTASGQQLCQYEQKVSRTQQTIAKIFEIAGSTAISGGFASSAQALKIARAANTIREVANTVSADQNCLGKSIIDNLLSGYDTIQQLEQYYIAYLEAAPFMSDQMARKVASSRSLQMKTTVVAEDIVGVFSGREWGQKRFKFSGQNLNSVQPVLSFHKRNHYDNYCDLFN